MLYHIECEKCGKITIFDSDTDKLHPNAQSPRLWSFVTCYGFVSYPCRYCDGRGFSKEKWNNGIYI